MASEEEPWYKAFPEPTETAPVFPQEKLLRMFQMVGDICNAGCLLIDLRRTDYEGGTIKGSLNIPAQSFYYNMAVLYRLCRGDGVNVISRVLFYCGSSSGRAPRCAGWFKQYVAQRAAEDEVEPSPEVFVLGSGIKGWVAGGDAYTPHIEGYKPDHWQQSASGENTNKRTMDMSAIEAPDFSAGGNVDPPSPGKKQRNEQPGAAV